MRNLRWIIKAVTICAAVSISILLGVTAYAQTYYVDSNNGNDSNPGTSDTAPWKTVARVNTFRNFQAGDIVCFKRGCTWRESLYPKNYWNNSITYTDYGTVGNKPLFLGSFEADPYSWEEEGTDTHIWKLKQYGSDMLSPTSSPSFYKSSNAQALYPTPTGNPTVYTIDCINPGGKIDDIQFSTSDFSVETNRYYLLTYEKNCNKNFNIPIELMGTDKNNEYIYKPIATFQRASTVIGSDGWSTVKVAIRANATTLGRIKLCLGNVLAGQSDRSFTLNIRNINVKKMDNPIPINDVGNIIFETNGLPTSFGTKVQNKSDLTKTQLSYLVNPNLPLLNRFWYDDNNFNVYVYSTQNPGYNTKLEIAVGENIIDQWSTSNITYNNLELKYGGKHAILVGDNTGNTTITNCDISYIGGCYLYDDSTGSYQTDTSFPSPAPSPAPIIYQRCGDGIEFWKTTQNNIVSKCNLSQIYDGALSCQGDGISRITEKNITFDQNTVKNCEISYEFEVLEPTSTLSNIYFTNNTCMDAGIVWGHNQRPNTLNQSGTGRGVHVNSYSTKCACSDIVISNNKFINATTACVHISPGWDTTQYRKIIFKDNHYTQPSNKCIAIVPLPGDERSMIPSEGFNKEVSFYGYEFSIYKKLSGKDETSDLDRGDTPAAWVYGLVPGNRNGDAINISWSSSTNAVSYYVKNYCISETGINLMDTKSLTTKSYYLSSAPNVLNDIYIFAVDAAGSYSTPIEYLFSTDRIAPSTPTGASVVSVTNDSATNTCSIALTWNPSTDNLRLAGYKIYIRNTNTCVGITDSNSITLKDLERNKTYYFDVVAYDTRYDGGNLSAPCPVPAVIT